MEGIANFQTLRNKLLHFICDINDTDLKESSERLLAYSIHIIMYLLYDRFKNGTPNEFFEDTLGWDFYDHLKHCKKYGRMVEEKLEQRGEKAWEYPMCLHITFSPDMHFCYCCNYELHNLNLTYCLNCDEPRSVIYHKSPLVNHPNVYRGWCLNCGGHPAVYECYKCHCCHEYYAENGKDYCSNEHCIHENGIENQDEYLHDRAEEVI